MRLPNLKRTCALVTLAAFLGCAEPFAARAELELTVMEVKTPCTPPFGLPDECLLVRLPGQADATAFYSEIEGFTFDWGVRQLLLVERLTLNNPPQDASSYRYRLLRVIKATRVIVPEVTPLDESRSDG